jgi:nicotinamidase-related amidase
MTSRVTAGDVLLTVDVQNDFCPGGRLAVPRGDEVVPIINRLGTLFAHVVLTQDWHPVGHRSFASSHPGKQPFETSRSIMVPRCCGRTIAFKARRERNSMRTWIFRMRRW